MYLRKVLRRVVNTKTQIMSCRINIFNSVDKSYKMCAVSSAKINKYKINIEYTQDHADLYHTIIKTNVYSLHNRSYCTFCESVWKENVINASFHICDAILQHLTLCTAEQFELPIFGKWVVESGRWVVFTN